MESKRTLTTNVMYYCYGVVILNPKKITFIWETKSKHFTIYQPNQDVTKLLFMIYNIQHIYIK